MCTSLGKSPSPDLASSHSSAMKEQQLTVALRIRPISAAEEEEGAALVAHKVGEQGVVLMDPSEDADEILRANRSREKTFVFDMVFDHRATQEEVYVSTTKSLIEGVISGYNATIFAYGPTGAGKTYTMLGVDSEPGIYIRTLDDLFKALEATTEEMDYTVSMSYLEIYNEVIRDLLNPSSGFLDLREDSRGNIQIAGITEVSTTNAQEIVQLLTKGNKQRTQEPTAANKTSSRSHAVLQVTVTQKSRRKATGDEMRIGKLFMVDLAGSERAAQSQNRGKRMKEGAHINRSLLALGNCINALSEKGGSRAQFVNFRDSKLTRLLKDSLGGNSRTVMIAHISPASTSFEESRMTLIYAYRAKNIKTQVKCNLRNDSYHMDQYTSIIADLRREIEHLKEKVKNQEKEKNTLSTNLGDLQEMSSPAAGRHQGSEAYSGQVMNVLRAQLMGAFREQMEMRRSLMELENTNIELHIDTCRHLLTITDWEREKAQGACKYDKPEKEEKDEDKEADITDSPEPPEVTVAREEINLLLAEQRKMVALKTELEQHLASAKEKASQMEEFFPRQITSEDQQEVLRLLCRAHELELGNTELQANTLYKENLLCQKDFVIQQLQQHMLLCEEIIQQQQMLIKAQNIPVPETLVRLHHLHLSELEEGTLNRLLVLHSVMSSTLRKPTGVVAGQMTPGLHSPSSLDLHGKKSAVDIAAVPLTLETLKEIAANTKSISLIAASRRFRAQCRDPGSEVSSTPFSENSTPDHHTRGSTSTGGLLSEPAAGTQLCSPARRGLKNTRDQEIPAERTARKKRSRSLEPYFHRLSKAKHWTPSSPNTDKACENRLLQPRPFHLPKAESRISIATKVEVPIVHHSEGTALEALPKDDSPASTIQQSSTDCAKGRVRQKQGKGPADGASSRQKQQPACLGNR
ncbi:kinesin-like protein KIF19 isoform X2 [Cuculus canorus]|uniref:kinesin-like protein KIF19 isoform X2 n=1 Tax=Cuculus canorus TaxID=55661 RepID=UPI0023AA86BD|nr:kinesin-like protein KIF19 isoform X2 [Cuculus canorus]